MASSPSLPTTVSASSSSAAAAAAAPPRRRFAVSFPLSSQLKNPLLPLLPLLPSKGLGIRCRRSTAAKAQSNEVVGGPSGGDSEGVPTSQESDSEPSKPNSPSSPLSDEAISEFMSQVASLVKLVDSRDIVELQLKQLDCELIIRKREALPQPPPAPVVTMQPPAAPAAMPPPAASVPAPAPALAPAPAPAPLAAPASAPKAAKSSHPTLKSPMAGTFYRSPGPGQPPFVKPGDKVNKGQVLCVIEAMKLMNEIEADHAGTLVEILVDDGKPVGIDQPLFVIEP